MYNESETTVVSAENLWWGSADGPYDNSSLGQCGENLGAGDDVSDTDVNQIDYCPYSVEEFNTDTCAQNSECAPGFYCSTGGSCVEQRTAGFACDESVTELDSASESNGVCSSGYCRDDYDGDGDGDGSCEAGELCWCTGDSTECATDDQTVANGSYAPNDCYAGGSGDTAGERAICNSGSWTGDSCGYGSEYQCNGSCSRSRDVFYCGNLDNTCYNGGSNDLDPCPAGSACSSGTCVSDSLCNSSFEYCGGTGDDQYNTGGLYYCQATCDGAGSCDFATTCELHAVVENLDGSLSAADTEDEDVTSSPQTGVETVYVTHVAIGSRIAEFDVDFSSSRDWTDVSAGVEDNKSFFHYPGGYTSLPGAQGAGYTLYVPIPNNALSNQVVICPGASSLGAVSEGCSNAETKYEADSGVSKVTIEEKRYWKVEGVNGTGGISLVESFDLRDILTRLEVGADSNHEIHFGTVEGIGEVGETFEIIFDPVAQGWDLSSITVSDIDVADDGTDLSLAATADATHWGVNINTSTDTITFTHPTDAANQDIAANSLMTVEIGTNATYEAAGSNQIVNPASVGEYEVHLKINAGSNTETGEVAIPIVDDDTVNVTGYIDTVMSFDIDTAVSDIDCDAGGGISPCNSHGGASDGVGYVVDLGELSLSSVNKSGDSVAHADGLTGNINYIWFDLETNAAGGAVVTVVSQYEALYKDSSNEIPSVGTGSEQQILAASGLYGINHRSALPTQQP